MGQQMQALGESDMKRMLKRAFRRIVFLGFYVISRLVIPILYNHAFKHGELTYLSEADFSVWKKAMSDMSKEYCLAAFNFNHRKLVYAFAKSKIGIVRKSDPGSPHIPIVVLCVKNDLQRIQMLVEHYRKLGIRKMAFLDNDSNDGTFEWLTEQPDVDLFRCRERYDTYVKEGWINRIVSHYGFDRWYIVTDSDELCTYIGMENHPVTDVVLYAEKNKLTRIKGLTIDMYADELYKKTNDIQRDYCWMDYNTYYAEKARVGSVEYPSFHGGPRHRLMKSTITLSKWPLVYWEKGTISSNAHYQYPHDSLPTYDCHIGILHYKFINDDLEVYRKRARKDSGFTNGKWYRYYIDNVEDRSSFMYEDSIVFTGSESLRKVSLISDMQLDKIG